jgi:hypothetical protein
MATKKDMRDLRQLALSLGWEAREIRCGWFLRHPSGATATLHKSGGSDPRNFRNAKADIMRPVKAA